MLISKNRSLEVLQLLPGILECSLWGESATMLVRKHNLVMWRGQVERERPNQPPVPHTIKSQLGDKKIFPMGAAIRIELYESPQIRTTQLNLVNIQKYKR